MSSSSATALQRERNAWKLSIPKRPSLYLLCSPLSMMDRPEGEFYTTSCGFLNLYRVCLLNHLKKQKNKLQAPSRLHSIVQYVNWI